MSMENVKKFYELAETDKDFAQKLASLDSEMSLEASDLANLKDIVNEKIIPLAKGKGLDFTAEEMVEFANEKYLQLSEEDLLDVSGGVSPKAAALGLSSVLLLSLGSAAAINLMNSNHDNVSNVVSDSAPSTSQSESEAEIEDEEASQKDIDEMLKKLPKEKSANMENIKKEVEELFKGGKGGGGSALKSSKGRSANKNMLNSTIGKKGTSDFDFDKILKKFGDALERDEATSQTAKPKAANSAASDFDFDKLMEETSKPAPIKKQTPTLTTEEQQHTLEEALGLRTAPIKETSKSAPISRGTPKKIEKTKEQVEAEKKQAQQQVDKRLADFKTKFETSFKEKFKTQCDDEDLKAFVQGYFTTSDNFAGAASRKGTTVNFNQRFSGGSVSDSVNVLDFAKELNAALPKRQYKAVSRSASWKDVMSHVMGALQEAKYDLSKFDLDAMQKLRNDIDWICGEMKASDGTYYLGASAFLGGAIRSNYGWNTKKPTLENKELEFLQALKASNYNKDDAKVQAALKVLSGDEIREETVKKPDASGEDQARIEKERKEAEEKARLREANNALPEKDAQFTFESQEAAQQIVDGFAAQLRSTIEKEFNKEHKTQLSEAELQQFVSGITDKIKSDSDMQKAAVVGSNTVTFFAKGQLKNGANTDASKAVNVLELAKELNSKLPKPAEEKKAETAKPQDEIKENDVREINAGGASLSEAAATKLVSEYTGFLPLDLTAGQQTVTLVNFLNRLGNIENLNLVAPKDRTLLAENIKHINDQIKTDKSGKPYLQNFYNWSTSADDLNLVRQAYEIIKDDFAQEEKKDETVKPQEKLKENPIEKPNAGAKVTTAKELQQQAEMQVGLARTELDKKFQAKIKANNGIELNEANLNKLINETLNSYKGKEDIAVNEQKDSITFTAKGTVSGTFGRTKDGVGSATLNVRKFFTKLNNEATEERMTSERTKFDYTKYDPASESDVPGGLMLARETAKKMIQEEFNKIIVEKYNAENELHKVTKISDIPAGKMATIVKSLNLDDVVARIVKANLHKVDDFKIKNAKKLNGQFSIKTAPENEELKITAMAYDGIWELGRILKQDDEISIRSEVDKLVEKHTVTYKSVVGGRASAEAEALYKFLTDNKLVENGTVVESVLDAIKDSDKEQFKKDVKHIADQISGGERSGYSLSGKWRSYKVDQVKLKAIKALARQLGV